MIPPFTLITKKHCFPLVQCTVSRFICDRAFLKLDNYDKEKERFASRVSNMESFWLRLLSENNVFEEDLKLAWILAKEHELSTIVELSEKYFEETSLFTSFKFGPVMMRTCHYLNKPLLALEIFKNPKFVKQTDDAMSVIILMDLLIETGYFEEASSVYEFLCDKEWYYVLRHPLVPMLYVISLYKQGTKDALDKALLCCKKLYVNPNYKGKVETIVAGFALKNKSINTAISLVARKVIESELAFNIKVQGHVLLSEWDRVFRDIHNVKHHSLYEDTVQLILNSGMDRAKTNNLKCLKTTVEERILAPLTLGDNKEVMTPIKKKFYN